MCPSYRVLLIVLAVFGSLPSCYPHRGRPVAASPTELVKLASNACRRHDLDAWEVLMGQLVDQHPKSQQARRARRLLKTSPKAGRTCRRTRHIARGHH